MAFLYKAINQLFFAKILKNYYNNLKNIIKKFNKALYALKQFLQFWYKQLLFFFYKKLGLTHININYSIIITNQSLKKLIISIFVNNIKIIRLKNIKVIAKIKIEPTIAFNIIDIRLFSFDLGLKVEKNC